jgi:membrane protein implicated in regulation of membrane protease activity
MLVFVAIAIASFILVGGSFLFGHDHDVGQDHGDAGHDTDAGGGEPTISIFSTKVLGTLFMGFGAAGAIASLYGMSHLAASLIGVACGAVLGGVMYLVLGVFYSQQASSIIPTSAAVGCTGTVTVSIGSGQIGEVGVSVESQYGSYSASSADGGPLPKGQHVRVVKVMGSQLIIEKET